MNREDLSARLLALFLAELDDQLRSLNEDLLELERAPLDSGRLRAIFRIVHTLKGAAHAASVPLVERVCHELESLLAAAREGHRQLGSGDFGILFAAADGLADARTRLGRQESLKGSPLESIERQIHARISGGDDAIQNEVLPVREPPLTEVPAELAEPLAAAVPPGVTDRPESTDRVRVDPLNLDALLTSAVQLTILSQRMHARRTQIAELNEVAMLSMQLFGRTARQLERRSALNDIPDWVRRPMQEMRDALQRVAEITSGFAVEAHRDAGSLAQTSTELADRVQTLRLQEFGEACLALPRAVRDLAVRTGKKAEVEIRGADVELDRGLMDPLKDVLLHLVRNALDHGIENPRERQRAGKPAVGRIIVGAAREGDRLMVQVSDDGRGIDLSGIRAELKKRGRALPEDNDELTGVLFEAGFSTRAGANEVSGRGVGLDAVRTTMARLRGSVTVDSNPGRGTVFRLQCPPTIGTVRSLLVRVSSQIVAISAQDVERIIRIGPDEVRRSQQRDVLLGDGAPVPLIELSGVLGFPPANPAAAVDKLLVVRVELAGMRGGLVIDDVIGVENLVVRPLERVPQALKLVNGATLLGTGEIAFLLDTREVLRAGAAAGANTSDTRARNAGMQPGRILVVDDSLTTRTLEQSLLEAAGFEVSTAADGAAAWKIIEQKGCDLVVSDVEMPVMDGLELCARIRSSKQHQDLPVILVSALENAEHRSRGLAAGADAYLPKSSFDEKDLLSTIADLLPPS